MINDRFRNGAVRFFSANMSPVLDKIKQSQADERTRPFRIPKNGHKTYTHSRLRLQTKATTPMTNKTHTRVRLALAAVYARPHGYTKVHPPIPLSGRTSSRPSFRPHTHTHQYTHGKMRDKIIYIRGGTRVRQLKDVREWHTTRASLIALVHLHARIARM